MEFRKGKILIIGRVETASVYDNILRAIGYTTRLFTYTQEIRYEKVGGGWQEVRQSSGLLNYVKEILGLLIDFLPDLIILRLEKDTFKLLEKVSQAYTEKVRPHVLLVVPKDAWFDNVDACISGPVDPEVLIQTVERLMQERKSV